MKLHSRILGTGQPLIILHGVFGSSDNWQTLGKKFSTYFEIHLVDLRNHGHSPHNDMMSYHEMANDIAEYIADHNLKKIVLLGHSMGGKVAMVTAQLFPDLLKKLIVVDISPFQNHDFPKAIIEGMLSIQPSQISKRAEADVLLSKYVKDSAICQFLLKNLRRNGDNSFAWRPNINVIIENMNAIMDTVPITNINTPTLFMAGGNSGYITISDWQLIKKLFIDAKLITIANSGHWIHAEQPAAFYDSVMNFIG